MGLVHKISEKLSGALLATGVTCAPGVKPFQYFCSGWDGGLRPSLTFLNGTALTISDVPVEFGVDRSINDGEDS